MQLQIEGLKKLLAHQGSGTLGTDGPFAEGSEGEEEEGESRGLEEGRGEEEEGERRTVQTRQGE
eukprot:13970538-Alexandrium_andersonii.AAC.1